VLNFVNPAEGVRTHCACCADDARTKATWQRLGFAFTSSEELARYGVTHHDLLHMDNTVQVRRPAALPAC
jgi:hypothetical protein